MSDIDKSPFYKVATLKARPDYVLDVVWDDGSSMTIDMRDLIREGTAFAPLRDPDLFATVRVGEYRQSIEWPDPINPNDLIVDYHADSLFRRGEAQRHGSLLQRFVTELRKRLHVAPSQETT